MNFPRLLIAGTHSGVGKTTLCLALMAALTRRGLAVQPFKTGPDFIDPTLHEAATDQPSRNLDAWLLPNATLQSLFCRHALARPEKADASLSGLSLIEGAMGLYDGQGSGPATSAAHVACLLHAPVVLIINGEGLSLSAAALVAGYASFKPRNSENSPVDLNPLRVAGVIINRVSGPAQYNLLRKCIEEQTSLPCLGYFAKNTLPPLPARHLGLVPAHEMHDVSGMLAALAEAAEKTLDIPALLALAHSAPPLSPPPFFLPEPAPAAAAPLRLGVAYDSAFSFYYADNLELLEAMGAELVFFSPLRDKHLPHSLDGLYLGGGFPEIFAAKLEANYAFRRDLLAALESGLPTYAECGGMLYLCSFLTPASPASQECSKAPETFSMSGFFPHAAQMTTRLQPFGYVEVTLLRDSILGPAGRTFRAHEFHYSRLCEPVAAPALEVRKADGRTWSGGLLRKNVLAIYPHVHFCGCPELARSFLSTCRSFQQARNFGALPQIPRGA